MPGHRNHAPLPATLAFACLLAVPAGCSKRTPLREWTPADHGQPQAQDVDDSLASAADSQQNADPEEPALRAARALWNVSCAGCHGRDGQGGGDMLPPGVKPPNFQSAQWQSEHGDDEMRQAIADGRGTMPPFGKQINAQGIGVLVRYVRGFAAPASAEQQQQAAEQGPGQAAGGQPDPPQAQAEAN